MHAWVDAAEAQSATPLLAVDKDNLDAVCALFGAEVRRWCAAHAFAGEAGRFVLVPGADGTPAAVLAGCDRRDALYGLASLPLRLPEGDYVVDARGLVLDEADVALGWALGSYQFDRYRKAPRKPARLAVDKAISHATMPLVEAIWRVRTLVNTPTEHMGPVELAAEVRDLADRHGATYREWVGDDLLAANFPTIHAVGRASHRAPRLAELTHGAADAPHLVLIGKGVCFDTGGLDIKPADGMRWMKKDMGGAAHAIALAEPRAARETAGAPDAARARGRERDRRQRVSTRRSHPHARGPHRRSRQHRRRRPPRAVRRARVCGRAEARSDPRLRDADRRRARRARP